MKRRFTFHPEKALEVLLYVAARIHDISAIWKVLYLADKKHLAEWGRLIAGEQYFASAFGPVPGNSYDILKFASNEGGQSFGLPVREALQLIDSKVEVLRQPDMGYFSKSDVESLGETIRVCQVSTYSQLHERIFDAAYKKTDPDEEISLKDIVDTLPDSQALWEYINT